MIPKDLWEQVQGREWEVDDLLKLVNSNNYGKSKACYLYALLDKDLSIAGVLWIHQDFLERSLTVQVLSVKKGFQFHKVIRDMIDFMRQLKDTTGMKKVRWRTTRPKAFEKYGLVRTKSVLMELKED